MPALKMKRKFSDDGFGDEFDACSKSTKSMKNSHSQVNTFEQSTALNSSHENCQDEADLTTQVATEDIGIMEASDFQDACRGASITSLKGVISEVAASPNLETVFLPNYEDSNSQLNLVDYVNEDGDGNPEAPNLIAVSSHDESWDSSQSCSLLDIFLPEEAFPLSFDTSTGLLTNFTTVYDEFVPVDALINMSGRYVVLPFIEKTVGASISYDEAASFGGSMCFNNSEVLEWLNQHLTEADLPSLTDFTELNPNPAWLPKTQESKKSVTLVLDLDETLVHSTMEHCDDADFTFPVFFDMKEHTVYVKKRPYLHMFLEKVAEMFEIVIFTASQSIYAEQLLDILDPEKKLISKRIFRESCIFTDGSCTKDLTILGVDLAKVAIIDNSPQVFQLQVNNGIPIKSWFDDPSDHALIQLIPFLETLAVVDDVRPIIAEKFGNKD